MTLTADEYAHAFTTDLHIAEVTRDRSLQTEPGISSLGVCKRQWQFMTTGERPSDAPIRWSAMIGTAMHTAIGGVRLTMNPHILLERTVHATLPNGVRVKGHVDEIDPTEPSVTDYKTRDGLASVRRSVSDAHERFQRHGYGLAVIQEGLVDTDQLTVRNVYIDRSGQDESVHVEQETFDPNVMDLAAQWVDEVAADTAAGRESEREKWPAWCESFCPFFTKCRLGVELEDISNPFIVQAARMIFDARKTAKDATQLVSELREEMRGVSGITPDGLIVRWSSDGKLDVKQGTPTVVTP